MLGSQINEWRQLYKDGWNRNGCDQHWKLLQTLSTLRRSYCFVTAGRGVLQLSKATQGHRCVSLLSLQQLHGQTFSCDQPRLDLQLDDRKEKQKEVKHGCVSSCLGGCNTSRLEINVCTRPSLATSVTAVAGIFYKSLHNIHNRDVTQKTITTMFLLEQKKI